MSHQKKPKPSVLSFPCGIDQSAFWRVLWPSYYLQVMEKCSYNMSMSMLRDSLAYKAANVVQIQRVTDIEKVMFLEKLCSLKDDLDFRLVYEIDDILIGEDMPSYHAAKNMKNAYNKDAIKRAMQLSDEVVVSTPYLREYYMQKFDLKAVTVVPNKMPFFWAGNYYTEQGILDVYKQHKKRPRILYAGSASHINSMGKTGNDDFSHVIEAIKSSVKDFHWIFLGVLPWELKAENEAGEVEFWPPETLDNYNKRISVLQCSMVIAPLADNIHNHAKSDVKFLDAAAHGLPIACQDMTPYKHAPIRFSTGQEMINVIKKTLESEESFLNASRRARKMLDKQWLELECNIALHEELFSYSYGHSGRKHLNKLNNIERSV